MSGFTDRHFFYGFFPEKNKEINKDFKILAEIDSSIVFFISAKKFVKIIPILKKFFLDRKILICKEITKLYEEYIRFDVSELDNFKGSFNKSIKLYGNNKLNRLPEIPRKVKYLYCINRDYFVFFAPPFSSSADLFIQWTHKKA